MDGEIVRYAVEVKGIVQGVGFRPYVFRLAKSLLLCGFVRNTPEGVLIEIEGSKANCDTFLSELKKNHPPLALIQSVSSHFMGPLGEKEFKILLSGEGIRNTLISPDIGLCEDCKADIDRKGDRRYRYAFTSCTNCGPRFTIVNDIPYDRKNTTMSVFPMCPDCLQEYEDPLDRRFHAQPNACPVCGPRLCFYQDGKVAFGDPYFLFKEAIAKGKIVALKGLGGYHLACDAKNETAVRRLRERKIRYDKPFAVMMRDIETIKKYCEVSTEERKLLLSPAKPIVLLKKKAECPVCPGTTLLNKRLGVMLPYTPLHYVLMKDEEALVMTSGNFSDNPMIFNDEEALMKLPQIADAVLTHNRRIARRMDDSVCVVVDKKTHFIRRARGYVPQPIPLFGNTGVLLALGAQQKNTFCLVKEENAFLSGHIGDLDDAQTEESFRSEIDSFIRIFDAEPSAVACDLHPDYVSTRYASRFRAKLPIFEIQHHHAHFASVLAEHSITDSAIGLIFDGTGYGADGCIWGGEALFGNVAESRRAGHLLYFPLLGGEAAVREPWRVALAAVTLAAGEEAATGLFPEFLKESAILLRAGKKQINSPLTSSMGRLFDAVSALAGVRLKANYEGQAAVDLQQIMDESAEGSYHFEIIRDADGLIFDWRELICEILSDLGKNTSAGAISVRFHRAVSEMTARAAELLREKTGSSTAVLSGGVFQNDFLIAGCTDALRKKGFSVYTNEKIPVNDGGLSFGQAAAASALMRKQNSVKGSD